MTLSTHETRWLKQDGAKMVQDLGVAAGDTVVDFGCGQGRYSVPLATVTGAGGKVLALERDEDSLAELQHRALQFAPDRHISVHTSDGILFLRDNIPNSVNAGFLFDVLQYIPDWHLLFSEFKRVLAPDGRLHIYPAAIPHPGDVDIEKAISLLTGMGFEYLQQKRYTMMHSVDMVKDIVHSFQLK